MKVQQPPDISFELVENAVDSVSHAIELMAWKDIAEEGSRLKQAILSVAHGVELLLKERLRRRDVRRGFARRVGWRVKSCFRRGKAPPHIRRQGRTGKPVCGKTESHARSATFIFRSV